MKIVKKEKVEPKNKQKKLKNQPPQSHYITGGLEDYQTFKGMVRYPSETLPITKADTFRTIVNVGEDVVLEDLKKVDFRGSEKPVTSIKTEDIKFDLDLDIPEDDDVKFEEVKQELEKQTFPTQPQENEKKALPKVGNKKPPKPPKPKKEKVKREKGESFWKKLMASFKSKPKEPKAPKEPKKPKLPKEPKKPKLPKEPKELKKTNTKIGIKTKPTKSAPKPPKPKNKPINKKPLNKVNGEQIPTQENDTISNLLNSETYRPGNNVINKNDKVGGGHDE